MVFGIWLSSCDDLPLLQSKQAVTKLLISSVPFFILGLIWSTSNVISGGVLPQYWHLKLSLLNTSILIFYLLP